MRLRGGGGRRIHRLSPREDVERELRAHIAMREQELMAEGWEESAARHEARRVFGDYRAIRVECTEIAARHARARGRTTMLHEFLQDLRYAVRWLAREPGFATVAILTLALGIGANSAAFGIVNGVLLSPLPYPDPDRLVALWEVNEDGREVPLAWPNFADWQGAQPRTVAAMAAHMPAATMTVLGGTEPARAQVAAVSGAFFHVLGVAPALGRGFAAEEVRPGAGRVVVVSDEFWRRHLGSQPDLSQLSVEVAGARAAVIGVMPPGFSYPRGAELWHPVQPQEFRSRTAHNFVGTARLAPGASLEAARAELSALAAQTRREDPESDAIAVALRPLHEQSVGDAGRALLILLGASGFVLLVACTNLASALLAKAARRRRELAVRAALGARRLRLVRQLLTESLLLAILGAAAGLLLAYAIINGLRILGPEAVPRLDEVRLDGWVLGFTMLLAVATALTFGTAPALRATTAQPFDALRESGRGTDSPKQRRLWSALVGAEVALALLLLVGSGLLMRSFWNIMQIDPGFDADNTLAVGLALPSTRYADAESRVRFYDEALQRLSALPGVEHAAVTMTLPLADFDPFGRFDIEGTAEFGEGQGHYRVVSPDFFAALRIPVLQGRVFTEADRAGSLDVIVINDALARRYFPDSDPLGRRIMTGGMDARMGDYATIIGVVGDVRHGELTTPAMPGYYLPYMQRPHRTLNTTLLVRTAARPQRSAAAVRAALRELDPDVPLDISTVHARAGEQLADRRFVMLLLAGFAAVALLLAGVGIYGVVAFVVAQRTREIGIRVALGAEKSGVLWLVSGSTMLSVALGVATGLVGAVLLARLLSSLLYGVSAVDPLTFLAVAAVLFVIAWAAVMVPASRALRVSPMSALRAE